MLWLSLTLLGFLPPDDPAWPAFRGTGDSQAAAAAYPLTWTAERHLAWSTSLPGYGQSSPVIGQGRVFVTSMDGAEKETPLVICHDLRTGERLWQREFQSSQRVQATNYVSRGAPTPVVDALRLYAFFESGDLLALDHDGHSVWQRSLTKDYGEFKGNHGIGSSLAADAERLYVLICHDGPSYLLAVDKQTGADRWKVDLPTQVAWTSPIVSGDEVLVSCEGRLAAFRTTTGELRWQVRGLVGNTVPSPTATSDLVLVASKDAGMNVAVRRGGSGDVSDTHVLWRAEGVTSAFGSPVIQGELAYFVNRAGVAYAVQLSDGQVLWKHRLGDSCWASPIATADRVYFFTATGKTVVLAAGRELQVLAENELPSEDRVVGVAAVPGRFVVRNPRKLVCIAEPE